MRLPWRKPETRASNNGGGDFFDAVVSQIEAQAATKAADAGATAAIEACSGQLSRALMAATVEGPDMAAAAITPAVLGQIGRDLIRGGASLWRIDTGPRGVMLREVAQWFWHQGRTPDPTTWRVRSTEYGPSGSVTHLLPFEAVVWLTWGQSTTTPWIGRSPASWAPLTAKLAAESERSLGDEAGGPVANLLPVPQDPASPDGDLDSDADPLAQLRADVAAARGRALLVETTAAGFGEGMSSAPRKDWIAGRLGPNPPAEVVEAARDAFNRMCAACGTPPALFDARADGTSQREALRRWHMGTVLPLARLVEHELNAKLETTVRLRFDLHATDLAGRASAFKGLVAAGMEIDRALAITGLLMTEEI